MRGLNRTEFVNAIPFDKNDPEVRALDGIRQDAESENRALEDRLWIGRAHSRGHVRQLMDLIGFGLMVNSLALHEAAHRAPPTTLAA